MRQQETDEAIAKRVQSGDLESFGILVDRYEAKLRRYARRFLFGREDVDDLVQEVFLKSYINIQSFDASMRFSPWIYRIAHNEFINTLRRRKFEPLFFFDADTIFPHPVAPDSADGDTLARELKEIMDQKIGAVDPKYREPLVLYFYEEMSYADIAEVLKIPISTVGVRIKRGKEKLKELLKEAK